MVQQFLSTRRSGILLHISSLPTQFGIGDFGPSAYAFADFLQKSAQQFWQVLPLNPLIEHSEFSPYCCPSVFAINDLFISPDLLVTDGWLSASDIENITFTEEFVDYRLAVTIKDDLLRKAFDKLSDSQEFERFCITESYWLDDYALFNACKIKYGDLPWNKWPKEASERSKMFLEQVAQEHEVDIRLTKFKQWVAFDQYARLKEYCNKKNVYIMGDMPIYTHFDSVDVWTYPENYKLTDDHEMQVVSGVPPDYFSKSGQRWGNPVYDWNALESQQFDWWKKRFIQNFKLYNVLRIDHFRGFIQYWEIPAENKTAVNGKWVDVPYKEFFGVILREVKDGAFVAEDLGIITEDVKQCIADLGFPGMKVLHFAFSDDLEGHEYLPHNYEQNCVAYTGTHDNNTTLGWLQDDATAKIRSNLKKYFTLEQLDKNVIWIMIEALFNSKSNTVIVPAQDYLELDSKYRMNRPGTAKNNWKYRLNSLDELNTCQSKLIELTNQSNRSI